MSVDEEVRGPLWVDDGRFTVRIRDGVRGTSRVIRLRRPFARIGRGAITDLRIDDPAVDECHALLVLDRRGLFGVDLRTESGTRFAGRADPFAWLGPGDVLEVAGRWIEILQLRVDGQPIDPPLSSDDPFADAPELIRLDLVPISTDGPPWMIGSASAFIGSGDHCAIRIDGHAASRTQSALLRTPRSAYLIDLGFGRTLIDDRPVLGAAQLLDGDILTVAEARFLVRLDQSPTEIHRVGPARELARRGPQQLGSIATFLGPLAAEIDPPGLPVLDALRQFQSDAASLFLAQIDRIEALQREMVLLRDEVRSSRVDPGPVVLPLALDPAPPRPTETSAAWLLDRINTLETESRSTWKTFLGKISTSIHPGQAPNLATTDQNSDPVA